MKEATANTEIRIKEFTVAPQVNPEKDYLTMNG